MKKKIVLLLKPMTKTSQVLNDIAVKSKVDVFRRVSTLSQMAFQDGGIKVSFRGL